MFKSKLLFFFLIATLVIHASASKGSASNAKVEWDNHEFLPPEIQERVFSNLPPEEFTKVFRLSKKHKEFAEKRWKKNHPKAVIMGEKALFEQELSLSLNELSRKQIIDLGFQDPDSITKRSKKLLGQFPQFTSAGEKFLASYYHALAFDRIYRLILSKISEHCSKPTCKMLLKTIKKHNWDGFHQFFRAQVIHFLKFKVLTQGWGLSLSMIEQRFDLDIFKIASTQGQIDRLIWKQVLVRISACDASLPEYDRTVLNLLDAAVSLHHFFVIDLFLLHHRQAPQSTIQYMVASFKDGIQEADDNIRELKSCIRSYSERQENPIEGNFIYAILNHLSSED